MWYLNSRHVTIDEGGSLNKKEMIHYSFSELIFLGCFFSQIIYQGPKQLIYTRGWRGSTRGNARQVHTVARPWQNPLWFCRILLPRRVMPASSHWL